MDNMKATGPNFQDLVQLILFSMGIQLFKNTPVDRINMFFSGKIDVELSNLERMLSAFGCLKNCESKERL